MRCPTSICVGLLVLASAWPAQAATTHWTGPVDRIAFQTLVDLADPGDTIVCAGGTYDFTTGNPVRIDKRLRIVAETPADPPIFVGSGELGGQPLETGNNAFVVYGLEEDVNHLEFENLHFEDFDRGLAFLPNYHPPTCEDPFPADLYNLRVAGCSFTGTRLGITVMGGGRDFLIENNVVQATATAIFAVGGAAFYPAGPLCEMERPALGRIHGNEVVGWFSGIVATGVTDMMIDRNTAVGGAVGIWLGDDAELPDERPIRPGTVTMNTVAGLSPDGAAILLLGPTEMKASAISKNSIFASPGVGIYLGAGANHFKIDHNQFDGSSAVDIYLDGPGGIALEPIPTHDNLVIAKDPSVTLADFGVDNQIVR